MISPPQPRDTEAKRQRETERDRETKADRDRQRQTEKQDGVASCFECQQDPSRPREKGRGDEGARRAQARTAPRSKQHPPAPPEKLQPTPVRGAPDLPWGPPAAAQPCSVLPCGGFGAALQKGGEGGLGLWPGPATTGAGADLVGACALAAGGPDFRGLHSTGYRRVPHKGIPALSVSAR